MQIELSRRNWLSALGWTAAWVFWLVLGFGILSLLTASDRTGAGMVIYFGLALAGMAFPILIIPVSILIYGVRKEHYEPLSRTLFKWSTIAAVVYLVVLCLTVAVLF